MARFIENRADRFSKLKSDRTYPMSNTKASRDIIRQHMMSFYEDGGLEEMMDHADASAWPHEDYTDWDKGKRLAQDGNFFVANDDVRDLLKQIYVPEDVDKWDSDKVWDRYTNLIGREYARMAADYRKGKK